VGIVDDDPLKQGVRLDGAWVVGTSADPATIAKTHDVGLVMFAIPGANHEEYERILSSCVDLNVRIVLISDMMRALQLWLTKAGMANDRPGFVVKQ
jgi:FlaA1/EpsC-like NDP-sugar epimerase